MTFAGEAVGLDWANPIDGTPFADEGAAMRYNDGATTTLNAGESFMVGFFDSASLVSGETVEFTFAIVCAAGSSGTLQVSGGVDPDFALDDPGDASTSLGTLTVSGAETAVSGVLPRDVDDYLTQAVETVAFIECTSGSVVIEQVKLYIWPVGGPVGGWVAAPGFTVPVTPSVWMVGGTLPEDEIGLTLTDQAEPVEPYEAVAENLVSHWGGSDVRRVEPDPDDWTAVSSMAATLFASASSYVQSITPLFFSAGNSVNAAASIAQQPDPDAVTKFNTPTYGESADVAFSPYEVPGDLGVQLLGSPSTAWGTALLTGSPSEWTMTKSGGGYSFTLLDDGATDNASGVTQPSGYDTSLPTSPPTDQAVTLPAARTVMLSLSADMLIAPAPYSADSILGDCLATVELNVSVSLEDSTVTVPPYRYWSPTAVPVSILRHGVRNDGLISVGPRRWGQESSWQHGRGGGYQ